MGGWAVPNSAIDEVLNDLAALRSEFMNEKASFMASYEVDIQEWISQFPAWDTVLQNSIVNPDYVRSKLSFGWQAFQVVTDPDSIHADGGLADATSQLGNSLFGEIASMAMDIDMASFFNKTEVSQKALSGFRRIHKKLTGLAFLDPKAYPIAEVIQTTLARMPRKGKISGADFFSLTGILGLLQDPTKIEAYATEYMAGSTSSSSYLDELVSFCPSASKPTILDAPAGAPVLKQDVAPVELPANENQSVIATEHVSTQVTLYDEKIAVVEESLCEVTTEAIEVAEETTHALPFEPKVVVDDAMTTMPVQDALVDDDFAALEESSCEATPEAIEATEEPTYELPPTVQVVTHDGFPAMDEANISMESEESGEEVVIPDLGRPMPQFDDLNLGLW